MEAGPVGVFLAARDCQGKYTIANVAVGAALKDSQAFQSPLLAECHSNSSGRDLAVKMKDIITQYGFAGSDGSEKGEARLVFGDPSVVEKPRTGMLIDI